MLRDDRSEPRKPRDDPPVYGIMVPLFQSLRARKNYVYNMDATSNLNSMYSICQAFHIISLLV
jgi:hypothetical protein